MTPTRFSVVYNSFLSKITEDMYLQLTKQDTLNLLEQLLFSAIPKFEFPRKSLEYEYDSSPIDETDPESDEIGWVFVSQLNLEEINVLATYMVVQWLGQQLASIENTRMKYSGSDFKFTSQANHMQKILQMKKDYERQGFHLQRLYKRRIKDTSGVYHSTMSSIVQTPSEYTIAQE